jgi:tetratricopeptide (TPR) repeat protein
MSSRNAPCPCGSGRKFKHCHGAATTGEDLASGPLLPGDKKKQVANALANPAQQFRLQVRQLISGRKPEQLELALEYLAKWQLLQPQSFEVLQRQLEIHLYQGRLELAVQCLRDWAGPGSQFPEFDYFSGVLAQLQGDSATARQFYAKAILQQRRNSKLAGLDDAAMNVATAIQLHETAAGNYPGSPGKSEAGMFGSAAALQQLENALLHWEVIADAQRTPELRSIHANAWYNLGCAALADFTADDRRIELFRKALEFDPDHLLARSNLAFAFNYSFAADSAQIFAAHLQSGQWLEEEFKSQANPTFPAGTIKRRLRLAYLSSDFRQHSVAHFILPVLQQHDRGHFEIFVYHNHRREDALSQQARLHAEHFENVSRLSDQQLLQRIRTDQIDVLIDLNGLSEHHRLAVLAQRAAPLQINWLGYPNTTGLTQVDYRIVDPLTDPPGQTEPYCTESLLRLPEPFLTFAAPADLPAVTLPPCLQNGFITLGSFNALPKLNPPLLRSWAGIMRQIPGSHLLIKNLGMDFDAPRDRIRQIFALEDISGERLIFAGKTTTQSEHLRFYEQVDISLDTFPYNGTTTTCDSLVMGVPVVSRAGEDHRSRVGLSLLSTLGLESLVASDENSLSGIVTVLAANPQELKSLRVELRARLMQSRLGDPARMTANLERELIHAWKHWQAKTQETHE